MKSLAEHLILVVMVICFCSCSTNNKKIQDKWWVNKEHNEIIIKFSSNGKFIILNCSDVLSYNLNKSKSVEVQLGDYNDKFIINNINDSELTVSGYEQVKEAKYRIAGDKDFIVGDWECLKNGKILEYNFSQSGDLTLVIDSSATKSKYALQNGKLIIDNEPYNLSFSNDKCSMTLSGKNSYKLGRLRFPFQKM